MPERSSPPNRKSPRKHSRTPETTVDTKAMAQKIVKPLVEMCSKYTAPKQSKYVIKKVGETTKPAAVSNPKKKRVTVAMRLQDAFDQVIATVNEVRKVLRSASQEEKLTCTNVIRNGLVKILRKLPTDTKKKKTFVYTHNDTRMLMVKSVLSHVFTAEDFVEFAAYTIGYGCDQLKGGVLPTRFDLAIRPETKNSHAEGLTTQARLKLNNMTALMCRCWAGVVDPKLTPQQAGDKDRTPEKCFDLAMTAALRQLVPRLGKHYVLVDTNLHEQMLDEMAEVQASMRHDRRTSSRTYREINSRIINMPSYKLLPRDRDGKIMRPLPYPSAVRKVWRKAFGKVNVIPVAGDGKQFKSAGVRCPVVGEKSVLGAMFSLAAWRKYFIVENKRLRPVANGQVLLLNGGPDLGTINAYVRWLA